MPIFEKLFKAITFSRLKKIEYCALHANEIQEMTFKGLIDRAKKTEFGKTFHFSAIKTPESFASKVPVQHYEELYPWINKIRQEEENVLWPGKIDWLAKSSGTTNDKSKYIPVTWESLHKCHYRGGTDSIILYLHNNKKSKLFCGKTITLGGSHKIDSLGNNIKAGDLSAIMIQNIPTLANIFRTPPKKIALLSEWNEKLEKLSNHIIKENITAFAGVPSWNMVLMKRVLEITGKRNLLEVWPNLELFIHGGVNFSPYQNSYKNIIPSENMHYMETYNASEGFFAIQNDLQDSSMLLMTDYGIYYEFIEMTNYYQGKKNTIALADVKTGVNYAMVISTNGGLWRYIIGDTVMFTSTNPYKIKITGRTKHYINAFGEELIVDNADHAIAEVSAKLNIRINDYTAAPVYMSEKSNGCHQWLIECDKKDINPHIVAQILDEELQKLNSDYQAKRYNNITLTIPQVTILPTGTFMKWFEINNKLGGQNKIPRLSNDRKHIESILKLLPSLEKKA
ncbi:MAG TPA: GH3 auxin-responsive promoter family protein [Bacteroidales bacterium]|nr:GH3 auxin-responsive promoter family protein [Bacteroidales bacterium]